MTEKQLRIKLYQSFIKDHTPSGNISISWLLYDCQRYGYYQATEPDSKDGSTISKLWIGSTIHEHSFLPEVETEFIWKGIKGRIDEYDPETKTLVEKKTTKKISRWVASHYKKQLEYYNVLMSKNGKEVKSNWLLFIQLEPPTFKFTPVVIRNLDVIEKEMLKKAEVIKKALKDKKAPERCPGWLCNYCSYFSKCYKK